MSLTDAINGINWTENVENFLKTLTSPDEINHRLLRIAVWSKQFEEIDKKNQAIVFIREMQNSAHTTIILTSLALYKSAASSIRTMIENSLYYTFFRTHATELATLVRVPDYYVSKSEIVEHHKKHTAKFKEIQEKLGLLSELDKSYSKLSAITHGQLPGAWIVKSKTFAREHSAELQNEVIDEFLKAEKIIFSWFMTTLCDEFWDDFSPSAKKILLKGIPGDVKALLKVDER